MAEPADDKPVSFVIGIADPADSWCTQEIFTWRRSPCYTVFQKDEVTTEDVEEAATTEKKVSSGSIAIFGRCPFLVST